MTHLASVVVILFFACGSPDSGNGGNGGEGVDAGPNDRPRNEQLIRSDPFAKLVLEVDSVAGFEPRNSVETDLVAGFEPILDKSGGIDIVRDKAIASRGADHAWTFGELDELAGDTFDLEVGSDAIKVHVLFVDGHHERDDEGQGRILGIAWSHTNIAMFKQTIEETCAAATIPPLLRERLCAGAELAIWTHELGHNLGLVDNGLPMVEDHRDPDPEHGAHDENDECVMFFAFDGSEVVDRIRDRLIVGGDETLGFDDECLADIAAVRDAP